MPLEARGIEAAAEDTGDVDAPPAADGVQS
jgi:hypothetical protein